MVPDRTHRLTQLVEGGQIFGEGGFGADLFGGPVLGDGPVVDPPGELVQRGPDGAAEDVGGFGVRQRGQ